MHNFYCDGSYVLSSSICNYQECLKRKIPIKSYTDFEKLLKFSRHEKNYDLMLAPGPVIRNNHFQLLNMLWKCGSNSQIWIKNSSNDDEDYGNSNDNNNDSNNKNNKGVNLMFNSTLTTERALKWVHTKLKLKGTHHSTKHTGRI